MPTKEVPVRVAAIYARVSSERGDEDSIPLQVKRLKAEAKRREFTVPDSLIFEEHNRTASKRRGPRPAYDDLVKVLQSGATSTVFVRETARLYRQPMELEVLLELMEGKGLRVIPLYSSEQQLDAALERNDIFMARVLVAKDAEESLTIQKRVRGAKAANREAGLLNGGGSRPYGYNRIEGKSGLVINQAEADVIKEIAKRVIEGIPPYRIALDLNARGISSGGGGLWRASWIKRRLCGSGPTKRSTVLYAGGTNWPAILTKDELTLVCAQLNKKTQPSTGSARKYALTGLVFCGSLREDGSECGTKMRGSSGFYRCAKRDGGCGKGYVNARHLEDLLDHRIQQEREAGHDRDKPSAQPIGGDPEQRAALLAELAEYETTVDSLADQLGEAKTETARRVVNRSIEKLEAKREATEKRLAALAPEQPKRSLYDFDFAAITDWHGRWVAGELTPVELDDLHGMFAAYFEAIRVAPGRGRGGKSYELDPSRIKVRWAR